MSGLPQKLALRVQATAQLRQTPKRYSRRDTLNSTPETLEHQTIERVIEK